MDSLSYSIERFDALDYCIAQGGVQAQSGEWVLWCPVCGKQKLTVNVKTKRWHCWICEQYFYAAHVTKGFVRRAIQGAGGLVDLIQTVEGLSRTEAVRRILASSRVSASELGKIHDSRGLIVPQSLYDANWFTEMKPPAGACAITEPLPYMVERRLTMQDVHERGLFYCTTGIYANRLIFPVWQDGRLMYWQARAMWCPWSHEKGHRKTLNPPGIPGQASPSDVLFGFDLACQSPRVVITEGPIDAIRVGPDAVATFGKRISHQQIALLVQADIRGIDLMWDADAKETMHGELPRFQQYFAEVRIVYLPSGDPADYTREQLMDFRRRVVSFSKADRLGSI